MTFDQRPPAPSLRRRLAQATRGLRLGIANGVARALGLKLQAFEPQRPAAPPPAAPAKAAPAKAAAAPSEPTPKPAPVKAAPVKAEAERPPRFTATVVPGSDDCAICGDPLAELKNGACPNCNSPARLRTLPPVMVDLIAPAARAGAPLDKPLLGFAMTGVETQLVRQVFPQLKSVSLFGSYGKEHETGVDARDMPQYADGSFSAHFSILLFDYFVDHAAALREAFRVLAPGGIFFTHTAPFRLLEGWEVPDQVKEVRGRPGYFDYLPQGVALADVKVGRQWFLQAMEDAGFRPQWVQVHDRATAQDQDWFIGHKPE
jgi:SAM-dependent methyltransferase